MQLVPGAIVANRYRVERALSAGGMGAVYVVSHLRTRATMALKVMHPSIVADETLRGRFMQEAQVSSQIDSPHVVTVVDADVDEATGVPFLVMELLQGRELGDLLRDRGRFTASETVQLLAQAARALDKAHALGIVHRDLKPENLFLVTRDDEPSRVKILDFGIAKILNSAAAAQSTQGGGTPLFMAPEQTSKSRQIGPWTDIFALGLIAYTFLVGRPYWEADSVGELFGELLATTREPPSQRAARHGVTLPIEFDVWFLKACHADPAQRFPKASVAVQALEAALAGRPVVAATAPASVATVSPADIGTVPWQHTQPMAPTAAVAPPPTKSPARSNGSVWWIVGGGLALVGALSALVVQRLSVKPASKVAPAESEDTTTKSVTTTSAASSSSLAGSSSGSASTAPPAASSVKATEPASASTATWPPAATAKAPSGDTTVKSPTVDGTVKTPSAGVGKAPGTCLPGTLNAAATCDCPSGYASAGEPGSAWCKKLGGCKPGTLNADGVCDCPSGWVSKGPPGQAACYAE